MTNDDRADNERQYLHDIGQAIRNLVIRSGGVFESDDPMPRELTIYQRPLFVHSGIAGILATAVMHQDRDMIDFFDWILGYYIHKGKSRAIRDQMLEQVVRSFHDQVMRERRDDEEANFVAGLAFLRLAGMILAGHIDTDDLDDIHPCVMSLLDHGLDQEHRDRQRDVEKN